MRTKNPIIGGLLCVALAALPLAAASKTCAAGEPNAVPSVQMRRQADNLFQAIQLKAQNAVDHAAELKYSDYELGWQPQADLLNRLATDVNDMGTKLCRLESIRSGVAPWQQRVIDRIAVRLRLMADSTQDAIAMGNSNQQDLWNPVYQKYVSNVYADANRLTNSTGDAIHYAKVHREYRDLRGDLGIAGS